MRSMVCMADVGDVGRRSTYHIFLIGGGEEEECKEVRVRAASMKAAFGNAIINYIINNYNCLLLLLQTTLLLLY